MNMKSTSCNERELAVSGESMLGHGSVFRANLFSRITGRVGRSYVNMNGVNTASDLAAHNGCSVHLARSGLSARFVPTPSKPRDSHRKRHPMHLHAIMTNLQSG